MSDEPDKLQWSRDMSNSRIEGSNDSSFLKTDTLYTIIKNNSPDLNFTTINMPENKNYRYWRFIHSGKRFGLGELVFLDENNDPIKGNVILSDPNKEGSADAAFDNNPLTYAYLHSWLGMDMGHPVCVKSIRYIPRTDANGIDRGTYYDLLYLNGIEWISLGIQKAVSDSLVFKEVPSNALFWLRNLKEGMEERIFTYDKGFIQFY